MKSKTGLHTDQELLAAFVRDGSDEAFAEITLRHASLVYHTARRILSDAHLAEDAAQATFLILSRKAATLSANTSLSGWLFMTAQLTARNIRRGQRRREKGEWEAAAMFERKRQLEEQPGDAEVLWRELEPHLDEALAQLPESQRNAIVLRCLKQHSPTEAARELGCSENAVGMRMLRGLENLKNKLQRRKIEATSALLLGLLSLRTAEAAPAGLVTSIQAACLGKTGASETAVKTAEEVIKNMIWIKLKANVAIMALIVLLGISGAGILRWVKAGEKAEKPSENAGHAYSTEADALRARFAQYYLPVRANVAARAKQYALPLTLEKLSNVELAQQQLKNAVVKALFLKNGFVADLPGHSDNVADFYKGLKTAGVPVFITSDSLLHLYHIQFDETLRDIEERVFFGDALALSKALYDASIQQARETTGIVQQAARLNAAYFAVALECLAIDKIHEELVRARAVVSKWTKDLWQEENSFQDEFPNVIAAIVEAQNGVSDKTLPLDAKQKMLKLIDLAMKKHAAGRKEVAYTLGEGLLEPHATELRKNVAAELALIEKHEGFAVSPLFQYKEDYSQYVPRGHYTRSEKLQRYFKALMWLGRMTMLIKGGEKCLVSAEVARVQTTAGVLAAELLESVKVVQASSLPKDSPKASATARKIWERIYAVTAFYVGFADDLTPFEYRDVARKVARASSPAVGVAAGGTPAVQWNDDAKYKALRIELARLRSPAIYSGTGACEGPKTDSASEADLLNMLENTKGFRLMGQRYIPDSYMFGRLVYPTVGYWGGGEFAFTTVNSEGGIIRGFPRGLDVMAVLGSERAREIVGSLHDDNYVSSANGSKSYDDVVKDLRKEFSGIDEKGWNQNLYWSWLYSLKGLLQETGAGYPTFMQTTAWKDKQLSAVLGSWSQLRHDTILYAKQSYTGVPEGLPPPPKMVEGYVEPVPEFYARLLSLTRMTHKGLVEMNVLSPEAVNRLEELQKIIERLLELSTKELADEVLLPSDYEFIRNFGAQLTSIVAGVSEEGLQTSIIADVHTDQNTLQVLEEGTGKLRSLWVAYPMPDGGVVLGCGPAFSYYEFKHPMKDRLTDEKWKTMVESTPPLPEWTGSFGVVRGK